MVYRPLATMFSHWSKAYIRKQKEAVNVVQRCFYKLQGQSYSLISKVAEEQSKKLVNAAATADSKMVKCGSLQALEALDIQTSLARISQVVFEKLQFWRSFLAQDQIVFAVEADLDAKGTTYLRRRQGLVYDPEDIDSFRLDKAGVKRLASGQHTEEDLVQFLKGLEHVVGFDIKSLTNRKALQQQLCKYGYEVMLHGATSKENNFITSAALTYRPKKMQKLGKPQKREREEDADDEDSKMTDLYQGA